MESDYVRRRIEKISFDLLELINELSNEKDQEIQDYEKRRSQFKLLTFPKEAVKNHTAEKEDSAIFNKKEINEMPKAFRTLFKKGNVTAHVRNKNGRFEIRCQLQKQKITASNRLLETAKKRFIEKLNIVASGGIPPRATKRKSLTVCEYMAKWLETVKKPYVKPDTYKSYIQIANAYIYPIFGTCEVDSITAYDIQTHINEFNEQGKFRTAKKVYQLLSAFYDYAEHDGKVKRSPMGTVIPGVYEQEHGQALTREEEHALINALKANLSSVCLQSYVFMLYTGLRRSELSSAVLSDDGLFVTVITAKQRKGKQEKRRNIPVSPMLKTVLPLIDLNRCVSTGKDYLTSEFKKNVPSHHLHDLRHTFITRAQECGISRELVSVWVGHSSPNITERVYTHLDKNMPLQLAEIAKFIYDF